MNSRIKLYTLWAGKLPNWMQEFRSRVSALDVLDWNLLHFETPEACCADLERCTTVKANKGTAYSCGDLRPLLGVWQHPDSEWWGWCDLDVVLGNLDALLPPLLDSFDVISAEPSGTAGCLTLFRNKAEINNLWKLSTGWETALADSVYRNFDEIGFSLIGGNPSITRTLRHMNLRCHFDWRSWHEEQEPLPNGSPSRICQTNGKSVMEQPTGRELLLYHFRSKNGWPKNEPTPEIQLEGMREWIKRGRFCTILNPDFWTSRLKKAKECSEIHRAVADVLLADWEKWQERTRDVLKGVLKRGNSVLDCGCGPGLMRSLFPSDVSWLGVDFCQEMVAHVNSQRPHSAFVADLRDTLPYAKNSFDWCVCRNLESDADAECATDWQKMKSEMLRVAPKLLLINFWDGWRVVERSDEC
jgi:hypothetical protein